jgi:glycosyltransferase involved in cell wall biosynthesis
LKIALICDWYTPRIGGLEMQMRDLARNLKVRGHEVHVITSTPAGADRAPDSVPVHRLDLPLMPGLDVIRSRSALVPLERVIADEGFDVLHCHTALSPLAHGGTYLGRKLGIPSVMTEHSVLRGVGGMALRALNRLVPWASWPDVLSGVSRYVKGELQQVTGRTDVEVLPNGVHPKEWLTAHPAGRADDVLRIVSTMRLTRRKRPIEIVRAIPKVLERLPGGVRPKFCIIGGGPEEARVRREARRLGVEAHLELPGWQPRPQVKDWLSRSSLFILPTSKEALSIATLEALCAGLPVVALDHGGVGDIVVDGREGFLARSSDEFIDRIVRLASDRVLRRRMAQASRAHVDRFSWDVVIARHLQLYRHAMALRGRASYAQPKVA